MEMSGRVHCFDAKLLRIGTGLEEELSIEEGHLPKDIGIGPFVDFSRSIVLMLQIIRSSLKLDTGY
jgi:hypothetical protein